MRGGPRSDVIKVWMYAALVVAFGAWLAPLVYNGGKALAEVTGSRATNGPLEWLGEVCRERGFRWFYQISLWLVAAALFFPWLQSLEACRPRSAADDHHGETGHPLRGNLRGVGHMAGAFLLATGLWLVMAMVLVQLKVWNLRPAPGGDWLEYLLAAAAAGLGAAFLLERVFRGIAMGVFLRAMKPLTAGIMVTALFVLVMAAVPPPGMTPVGEETGAAGIEMLRQLAVRLGEPRHLATWLLPWAVIGGVLARARWRTASLWLPMGLHAAWYFTRAMEDRWWVVEGGHAAAWTPWLFGLPAAAVLLAGLLMDPLVRARDDD